METHKRHANDGLSRRCCEMANDVFLGALGPAWVKKHVGPVATGFFRRNDPETGRLFTLRYSALGDMIYRLRDLPDFDHYLAKLQTNDLYSTYFELRAINAMRNNDFSIEIIKESKLKGRDFDFRAKKDDFFFNCEVKSKIDGIQIDSDSLINPLIKARKQLPKAEPAIIFLVLPANWLLPQENKDLVLHTVETFLRNTNRVHYVVAMGEAHRALDNSRFATANMGRARKILSERLR